MTADEPGDTTGSGAPSFDEPSFDEGRRQGSRVTGGLPLHVALEELEAPEVPRRRWSDREPDDAPAPPRLDFQKPQPPTPALLIDDPAADAVNRLREPAGGPQFLGRAGPPKGVPERRRTRGAALPDIPPPGTRISAWSRSGPVVTIASPHAGRAQRVALRLLLLVCLSVIGVVGYPLVKTYIRERSVPTALRPYVAGKGVPYAPAGQGFAARLPEQPVHRDGLLPAANGMPSMFVHRSIASGAGYEIVIRVIDVPDGMPLPFGAVGALADSRISGAAPVNVRRTSFAGSTAFDYEQRSTSTLLIRGVVFLHAQRLYVIGVQAKSGDVVLQTLGRSFRFTP